MRLPCPHIARFALVSVVAIALLGGCAYSKLGRVYDGQETEQIRLSQLRPRKPLRASITYQKEPDKFGGDSDRDHSEDGLPAVTKRLEDSGYFASIRQSPAADDDVRIVFGGTWCTYYKVDNPAQILVGMITLPLLLPVPNKQSENHCDSRLSYSLRGVGASASETTAVTKVRYGYERTDYTVTPWWKWAYTGESRQQRQWDYLMDQSVAKFLNVMLADWNQRTAARYKKGGHQ